MRQTRLLAFAAMLLWVGISCQPKIVDPDKVAINANPDWTTASHSKEGIPDYSVVFPQDKVNTLEITMTAAMWQSVLTDMSAKFGGSFGAGGAAPGGAPGAFSTVEPNYVALPVTMNGKTWKNVGFRLKGNSSLSSSWRAGIYKLPFRLNFDEFEDTYPEINDQRFYGFKELSMSPGFGDASLIREKVAADIFRQAGVPAAQTAFYKVYIDFGAGRKYCGIYTMVEVIDDTMVESQYADKQGNIYKPESTFLTFNQAQFEKKNNKTEADYSDVRAFITALNSPDRTANRALWRSNLEKTFNMDHYLKFLAVNNTMVNWDTYGAIAHNYYFYTAPDKRIMWIPWDHNEALKTTAGAGGNIARAVSLPMTEVAANWPLLKFVAEDPVYMAKYRQNVKTFTETIFTVPAMNALVERNHALIAPFVNGTETEQKPYSHLVSPAAFTSALPALKTHITARNQAAVDFVK